MPLLSTFAEIKTSRFGEKGPFVSMWIYLLKNYRKAYEPDSTSREEIALSSYKLR